MEKLTRDELEKISLESCSAEDYYDLADSIDSESDATLYSIIESNN